MRGTRRRMRKQLLDEFKETVGYLKLKDDAVDHPLWRTGLVRGYGPVVRQSTW